MNTKVVTPRSAPAARCSASRILVRSDGVIAGSSLPLSPFVTITYVTSAPARVQPATVPAVMNSASSGCATTTIRDLGTYPSTFDDTTLAPTAVGVRGRARAKPPFVPIRSTRRDEGGEPRLLALFEFWTLRPDIVLDHHATENAL